MRVYIPFLRGVGTTAFRHLSRDLDRDSFNFRDGLRMVEIAVDRDNQFVETEDSSSCFFGSEINPCPASLSPSPGGPLRILKLQQLLKPPRRPRTPP